MPSSSKRLIKLASHICKVIDHCESKAQVKYVKRLAGHTGISDMLEESKRPEDGKIEELC